MNPVPSLTPFDDRLAAMYLVAIEHHDPQLLEITLIAGFHPYPATIFCGRSGLSPTGRVEYDRLVGGGAPALPASQEESTPYFIEVL